MDCTPGNIKDFKQSGQQRQVFDGTARSGEALAIVVPFFQEDLKKPTQCLIRLEELAKALKGEKLAQ